MPLVEKSRTPFAVRCAECACSHSCQGKADVSCLAWAMTQSMIDMTFCRIYEARASTSNIQTHNCYNSRRVDNIWDESRSTIIANLRERRKTGFHMFDCRNDDDVRDKQHKYSLSDLCSPPLWSGLCEVLRNAFTCATLCRQACTCSISRRTTRVCASCEIRIHLCGGVFRAIYPHVY